MLVEYVSVVVGVSRFCVSKICTPITPASVAKKVKYTAIPIFLPVLISGCLVFSVFLPLEFCFASDFSLD